MNFLNLKRMNFICFFIPVFILGCGAHKESPAPLTPENELIEAVKSGDFEKTKKLLDQGVNPQTLDTDGDTAIHLAMRFDKVRIAQLLCEKGAKSRYCAQTYNTKLIDNLKDSISTCNKTQISDLLEGGANPNGKDGLSQFATDTSSPPLHLAAASGCKSAARRYS